MLVVVNYHYVRPEYPVSGEGIHGITPADFDAQLRLLGHLGSFVSLNDVLRAVAAEIKLPERAMLVTFDDGLQEQYVHALPVLERHGIPAAFFVNTMPLAEQRVSAVHQLHLVRSALSRSAFLDLLGAEAHRLRINMLTEFDENAIYVQYPFDAPEIARVKFMLNLGLPLAARSKLIAALFSRVFPDQEPEISEQLYLTREMMVDLASRGWLASHAHDHLPLAMLEPGVIREMLSVSASLLEQWTGVRPRALSYPYGSFETCSRLAGNIARESGYAAVFTVERAGNDAEALRDACFLARLDSNDVPGGRHPVWTAAALFSSIPPATWHRLADQAAVREVTSAA